MNSAAAVRSHWIELGMLGCGCACRCLSLECFECCAVLIMTAGLSFLAVHLSFTFSHHHDQLPALQHELWYLSVELSNLFHLSFTVGSRSSCDAVHAAFQMGYM